MYIRKLHTLPLVLSWHTNHTHTDLKTALTFLPYFFSSSVLATNISMMYIRKLHTLPLVLNWHTNHTHTDLKTALTFLPYFFSSSALATNISMMYIRKLHTLPLVLNWHINHTHTDFKTALTFFPYFFLHKWQILAYQYIALLFSLTVSYNTIRKTGLEMEKEETVC